MIILVILLLWLSLLAASLVIGGQSLRRAIRSSEHRFRSIALAVAGFGFAAYLTYPFVLGPTVAAVACRSSVGLKLNARVDLSAKGFEIDWPPGTVRLERGAIQLIETPTGILFEHALDDLISRRVAYIETGSLEPDTLHRITLGPDSSADCVEMPSAFAKPLTSPPAGTCLRAYRVEERHSEYVLKSSASFDQLDAFERSVELLERASGNVLASYAARRIPMARFQVEGDGARYCPADAQITQHFYDLAELVSQRRAGAAAVLPGQGS